MKRILMFAALALLCAACSDDKSQTPNKTPGGETDETVVMTAAYPFYDAYDDSSGRYRLSIPLCTKSNRETPPFTDLMLYIYMKTEPSKPLKLPVGTVTPFYTDGRELPELVYYIGEHYVDEEGQANARGTSWFTYTDSTQNYSAVNCAEQGSFLIAYDAATASYTISGTLTDRTTGRALKFIYTGNPKIFDTEDF